MTIKAPFTSLLLELAEACGIRLSQEQASLCRRHASLMLAWNRRVNLTRITEEKEILVKHFMDSLMPARHLPSQGLAMDVGAGAGFPGIPLRILHPDLRMVLLESQAKKVSFLKVLLAQLQLKNTRALQGKWEDFCEASRPLAAEPCHVVVMRALEPNHKFLSRFAGSVLRPGGIFAWWAGPSADPDKGCLNISEPMVHEACHEYELPMGAGTRRLFLWKRKA